MILVVGGAYQGKMEYVQAHYGESYFIKNQYHLHIKKQMENGLNPLEEAQKLVRETHTDNMIVICDEVGCGVVPVKEEDRRYREMVGRVCCYLAQESVEVVRVVAGIGTKIKTVG